jgi:hypothetical protein
LQAISEQPHTVADILILPYKEEVAGSNPASPTFKVPANSSVLHLAESTALMAPLLVGAVMLFAHLPHLVLLLLSH